MGFDELSETTET